MAADDIYYQVWVHSGLDDRVHVVETCKTELMAKKCAAMRNAAERHDTRAGQQPLNYYFVQQVTEAQLHEAKAEEFRRRHESDKKRFMQQYHEEMRPYAQEMGIAMMLSIETCEWTQHNVLTDKGGWIEGYRKDYGGATITCSALYSGNDSVSLEVAIAVGAEQNAAFVKEFENETALEAWLYDAPTAAKVFENRLVDLCCDRYRPRLRTHMEKMSEQAAMLPEELPFASEEQVFQVAEILHDIPIEAFKSFLSELTSNDVWAAGMYNISIDYLTFDGHELTAQPCVHCTLLNPKTLDIDDMKLSISNLLNVVRHVVRERMPEVAGDEIDTSYLTALGRNLIKKLDTLL
ncbi:MAG: hypothetical protein K6B13_01885 [Prevotella sp.]|nr:hypothetical protein [Prevotella sp.]